MSVWPPGSESIAEIKVFYCLTKENFINSINIIFTFGHNVTEVLFVTKDDKCYGLGGNTDRV